MATKPQKIHINFQSLSGLIMENFRAVRHPDSIQFFKLITNRDGTFRSEYITKDKEFIRQREARIRGIFQDDYSSILQGLGHMSANRDELPVYPPSILDRLCELTTFLEPDIQNSAWRVLNEIVRYDSPMIEHLLLKQNLFHRIPPYVDSFTWLEMVGNLLRSSESCRRYLLDDPQVLKHILDEFKQDYVHAWEKAFVLEGLVRGLGVGDQTIPLFEMVVSLINENARARDLSAIAKTMRTFIEIDPSTFQFLIESNALSHLMTYEKREDDSLTSYYRLFTFIVGHCPNAAEYLVSDKVRIIVWIFECIQKHINKDSDDDIIVHDLIELLADVINSFGPARDLVPDVVSFIISQTDAMPASVKYSVLRLLFVCLLNPHSAISQIIIEQYLLFLLDSWQLVDRDMAELGVTALYGVVSVATPDTLATISSMAKESPAIFEWMETVPGETEMGKLCEFLLQQLMK